MASSAVPQNPTSHHVASLLPKLQNADPDIRFMSLNDLYQILLAGHATFLVHDYTTCARLIEGLLHTLVDQNGDVQNMSIKCLGPFVNRAPENILCPLFDKISNLNTGDEKSAEKFVDKTITALAVRAIVVALPRPVQGAQRNQKVTEAYSAVSRALIPRLVGYVVIPPAGGKTLPAPPKGMLQVEIETGQDSNALEVLTEVARCFGPMLQDAEVEALEKITMEVLETDRCGSVMKKKAVTALSMLASHFSDGLLSSFISYTIEQLRQSHLTASQRRLYLTLYGSMARSIPRKFGPYLKTLAPFVLAPLSQAELDEQNEQAAESDESRDAQVEEVREAALVALDAFEAYCSYDMEEFAPETMESALRFLKYDPNFADDDDDEEMDDGAGADDDMDDFDADEDFEEETGFDDEDDVSWKVRRCAAKLLRTLAGIPGAVEGGLIYSTVVPALISRFNEREESVRLEVLNTLTFLIKTTEDSAPKTTHRRGSSTSNSAPISRKRRRGSSNATGSDTQSQLLPSNGYASPSTPPPQTGPQQSLAKANPEIVRATAKVLKSSTIPTKQAAISLLTQMVAAQHGGLSKGVDLIIEPVTEVMKTAATGTSGSLAATQHTLRIEALRLLRVIAETHSSKVLQPYLGSIIPGLVIVCQDKYSKVAVEAFETVEVYVKALTPPRSAASQPKNGAYLQSLFEVISQRIATTDTDTEVRQKAIHALGLLIGRTSGSQGSTLLSQSDRAAGLQIISERLQNELTRLASVRAVDIIAVLAQDKNELEPEWVREVSLALGSQLRKASRSLRGASLSALKMLAINSASRENLDDETMKRLVDMLLPLINEMDLHMLGPALIILGAFAKDRPQVVLNSNVISGFCFVAKMDLHGSALDSLLVSVETIGKQGQGKDLMAALLRDVGVSGNPEIVGQVIGTLLVAGGPEVGVTLEDFRLELKATSDERRKCLALYILGEVGLRMGGNCSLKPQDFSGYFNVDSEKVHLAAAISLGRAGAGNVGLYLPDILSKMGAGKKYLLLHSVKELLQHSTAEAEIVEHSKQLWDNIIAASQADDNKTVGAECIGRLAIIDPSAYLPQLQVRIPLTFQTNLLTCVADLS